MKSIVQENWQECYLCGRNRTADPCGLEEHHSFEGNPGRKLSEKYGLKIHICGERCHRNGAESVHKNKLVRRTVQAAGQKAFEKVHGTREDFYRLFGRYYD